MAIRSAHGVGAQRQTGGWWVLSNSSGASTLFLVVQSANPPRQTTKWPNAPIGPFNSQAEANALVTKAKAQGGFGISPTGKGSATGTNIANAGSSLNPISWFQQATGGILAGALEQGFIQIFKDLWAVIVGPLEIIAGVIIALLVLAMYFKNDVGAVASMVATRGAA